MNENINLYEILKGHEGECFYSESLGNVTLHTVEPTSITITTKKYKRIGFKCSIADAIDDLFPSKDQRDWIKWDRENNNKTPKTWNEYVDSDYYEWDEVYRSLSTQTNPIYKSIFALLKIHKLIEVSYGGNVTNEEWKNFDVSKFVITFDHSKDKNFNVIGYAYTQQNVIVFHTREQAEEFLFYPENIQLLKDYFMLN